MDPLENPFRPGAGTPPPALIGRDDLIHSFGVNLRRAIAGMPGKSMIPIGLRGVGKTVLLNRLVEIAQDEGSETVYLEAQEGQSLVRSLAAKLRTALMRLERAGISGSIQRALGILKGFTYTLPDGTSMQFSVDAIHGEADSGILTEDVPAVLEAIGQALPSGRGLLIAVDEIQFLDDEVFEALIMGVHRTTQQGLPVVLVGTGLPQVPGIAGNAKSYAERLFDFPSVRSLERDQAADVLRLPAQERGVEFHEEALELIVGTTEGYPYFLQEWGAAAWNASEATVITGDLARRIEAEVTSRLDESFFAVRFDRMTPSERTYLRAMAELGPGPHRSGEIADLLGIKVQSAGPRRSNLIKKGMIYSPAHGDTAFTVPLFDQFMRRRMPDMQVPEGGAE